jgi:hypothetical protein
LEKRRPVGCRRPKNVRGFCRDLSYFVNCPEYFGTSRIIPLNVKVDFTNVIEVLKRAL